MQLTGTTANQIANTNPKLYHLSKWDNLSDPQRLDIISEIIMGEGRDPSIAELAVNILRSGRVAPRDYRGQAAVILKWVQDNIYYINEPGERLQSPKYTLKRGFGDCDDMAILLCSLYESIGLPWKLVLSGNDKGVKVRHIQGEKIRPNVGWAHIYAAVGNLPFNPTQWFFAEPTIRGVPLGWDVVAANSNDLPELLSPRYSGISLGNGRYGSVFGKVSTGTGVGIGTGLASSEEGQPSTFSGRVAEIVTGTIIGVATAVLTELLLDYIKRNKIVEGYE